MTDTTAKSETPALTEYALRTYRSVWGQTENLFELWHAYYDMRQVATIHEVMNTVAPAFFGTIHRAMFQSVLLLIRQLSEPATTRVKKELRRNSSMRGLLAVTFGDDGYEIRESALADIVKRFDQRNSSPREWASKVVAHTDLAVGLDDDPLPYLPFPLIDILVAIAVEFVQKFEQRVGLQPTQFAPPVLSAQLQTLERVLRRGLQQ